MSCNVNGRLPPEFTESPCMRGKSLNTVTPMGIMSFMALSQWIEPWRAEHIAELSTCWNSW